MSYDCFGQHATAAGNTVNLPLDSDGSAIEMMMRGMSANNFDPIRYSGRWFEVASLKRGFAGQGQEDCHCTQVNHEWNEVVNLEDIFVHHKRALMFLFR